MQFWHNKMSKTWINQGNPEVTHCCLQLARRDKRYGLLGPEEGLRGCSMQSTARSVPRLFVLWGLSCLRKQSFGKKYYSYFPYSSLHKIGYRLHTALICITLRALLLQPFMHQAAVSISLWCIPPTHPSWYSSTFASSSRNTEEITRLGIPPLLLFWLIIGEKHFLFSASFFFLFLFMLVLMFPTSYGPYEKHFCILVSSCFVQQYPDWAQCMHSWFISLSRNL